MRLMYHDCSPPKPGELLRAIRLIRSDIPDHQDFRVEACDGGWRVRAITEGGVTVHCLHIR